MITNSREQKICDKYSAEDETGHVHCNECPLRKSHGNYDFRCKGNSHYNRSIKDWEYDIGREVADELLDHIRRTHNDV